MAQKADKDTTDAIKKINVIVPGSNPQFLHLDITSLKSAHSAAHEFLGKEDRLDILVNNAGIAFTPYQLSEDGIELQLCNAIGHFAFTFPLLDLLKKTSKEPGSHVRIVNVASVAHSWVKGTPDFSSVDSLNRHSYFTTDRYGLSKLMKILFTNELQRRLSSTRIICTSVHPGGVNTKLATGVLPVKCLQQSFFPWAISKVLLTPKDGAFNSLYAATALELEDKDLRAAYLHPFGVVTIPSVLAQDTTQAKKLWDLCEKLVREKVADYHPDGPKSHGMVTRTSDLAQNPTLAKTFWNVYKKQTLKENVASHQSIGVQNVLASSSLVKRKVLIAQ
ncbi:hypothetical protein PtA15_1A449 [Puccinia triticina]|uniref:Uncharacterized protein n=1 Tax=Puccinia triticina TaxID=208348 RepID=A0ABY7C7G2_9BASI|nr:uncharacterized protein PtA15_1A449 [Puccinia triticina]WAQ81111.1 hypothetical protein PtA15_1A449 [Puccinia triticina]